MGSEMCIRDRPKNEREKRIPDVAAETEEAYEMDEDEEQLIFLLLGRSLLYLLFGSLDFFLDWWIRRWLGIGRLRKRRLRWGWPYDGRWRWLAFAHGGI